MHQPLLSMTLNTPPRKTSAVSKGWGVRGMLDGTESSQAGSSLTRVNDGGQKSVTHRGTLTVHVPPAAWGDLGEEQGASRPRRHPVRGNPGGWLTRSCGLGGSYGCCGGPVGGWLRQLKISVTDPHQTSAACE